MRIRLELSSTIVSTPHSVWCQMSDRSAYRIRNDGRLNTDISIYRSTIRAKAICRSKAVRPVSHYRSTKTDDCRDTRRVLAGPGRVELSRNSVTIQGQTVVDGDELLTRA